MENEIWKPVVECCNYEVSLLGQIRNIKTGKVLKPFKRSKYKHESVSLYYENKQHYRLVHIIVWEAFNGPVPKGYEINHIDENPENNRLDNLNLMTHKENMNWGTFKERMIQNRTGKTAPKPIMQYDLEGNLIKDDWSSAMEIQKALGYANTNIGACCLGKIKTAYGFIWKYAD